MALTVKVCLLINLVKSTRVTIGTLRMSVRRPETLSSKVSAGCVDTCAVWLKLATVGVLFTNAQ